MIKGLTTLCFTLFFSFKYNELLLLRTRLLMNTQLLWTDFKVKLLFSAQINPVITNPGYNEQKWSVPSCLLKLSLTLQYNF
jgi:hypothetical protein